MLPCSYLLSICVNHLGKENNDDESAKPGIARGDSSKNFKCIFA